MALGSCASESFDALVRDDVAICSVMWVNNEIGTMQPIATLAERAKSRGVLFHTDAVQAFGNIPVSAKRRPFDILSLSGHKIGAPKGIGAIYIRRGTFVEPLQFGGSQDRGVRPGTENVAAAVALARAAELAVEEREHRDAENSGDARCASARARDAHPGRRGSRRRVRRARRTSSTSRCRARTASRC